MKTNKIHQAAVLVIALAAAALAQAKELPAGTLINKQNIDQVKSDIFEGKTLSSLLPEKVEWQIRNHGLALTLANSKPLKLDPKWLEATAQNRKSGTISFDAATRTVKGWVKGMPFPDITESDTHAGDKVVWNFLYGRPYGDSQELKNFHFLLIDGDKGLERDLKYRLDRYFLRGRLSGEPSIGDEFLLQNTLLFAEAPQDIKGIGTFTKRYGDGFKSDDVWAYVKSVRRVRRLSGAAWMDPVGGLDILNDDLDVWDSPPNWYKSVKLVGRRWILACVNVGAASNRRTVNPDKAGTPEEFPYQDLKTPPYWNPSPQLGWEPREVWVLEGTPPAEHPYGKKTLYVDIQANRPLMSEIYDKQGNFWKFHNFQQGLVVGFDGFLAILPSQGQQIDFKRRHSTNFVSDWVVNRKGAKPEDFSLGALEAAGK